MKASHWTICLLLIVIVLQLLSFGLKLVELHEEEKFFIEMVQIQEKNNERE